MLSNDLMNEFTGQHQPRHIGTSEMWLNDTYKYIGDANDADDTQIRPPTDRKCFVYDRRVRKRASLHRHQQSCVCFM